MIDITTKLHDKLSVEFKLGFSADGSATGEDSLIGMWIFVPDSLDINPSTFTKADFYRHLKSNVRLITPRYSLEEITEGPLSNVLEAAGTELEHQVKMYTAIAKSAVRDGASSVISGDMPMDSYTSGVRSVLGSYDRMPSCEAVGLCREFLISTAIHHSFKILDAGVHASDAAGLIRETNKLRDRYGYKKVTGDGSYLYRQGVLKKYVEHHLYLRAPRKKDGVLAEQAYYSVAAGLAMIFATIVAWSFQRTFGNLTWPLFIALIISYMMKDRIKELMRFWFAHRVGSRYFDKKAEIQYEGQRIGTLKEAFDFIGREKVPEEVVRIRNDRRSYAQYSHDDYEKVMLYRMKVHMDSGKIQGSTYAYNGVNDIIRLQMSSFLRMMDNPVSLVETVLPDGTPSTVECRKEYHMNIVLQCVHGGTVDWQHFRLRMTKDGIESIEKV